MLLATRCNYRFACVALASLWLNGNYCWQLIAKTFFKVEYYKCTTYELFILSNMYIVQATTYCLIPLTQQKRCNNDSTLPAATASHKCIGAWKIRCGKPGYVTKPNNALLLWTFGLETSLIHMMLSCILTLISCHERKNVVKMFSSLSAKDIQLRKLLSLKLG